MKRFFSFVSLVVLVAVVAAGCNFSISTANITNATLSKDVQGDQFEPVDPTTTFPIGSARHPSGGQRRQCARGHESEIGVDGRRCGRRGPGQHQDRRDGNRAGCSDGSAHFTLSIPDTGVWPVGKYKVGRVSQRQAGSHVGVHRRRSDPQLE